MKTKALLLAGLVSLAGAFASQAQTVYSVNAVGFVNVTIAPGAFQIISNPLMQSSNDLNTILPGAPTNAQVYSFDPVAGTFTKVFTKRSSGLWTGTDVATTQFAPGQAFFVKNPDSVNPMVLTFVGEVPQGTLQTTITAGYSLVASQVPKAGPLESSLGIPATQNDQVYRFVNGGYVIATRRSASWTGNGIGSVSNPVPGEPEVGVAEGFFYYNPGTAKTWSRTFSVAN